MVIRKRRIKAQIKTMAAAGNSFFDILNGNVTILAKPKCVDNLLHTAGAGKVL